MGVCTNLHIFHINTPFKGLWHILVCDKLKTILTFESVYQVHVATDGHQQNIPVFYGRPGIYVRGSVVPALAGVSITLVSEKNSQAGGLKAGEVAMSTVTGSDGKYVAGPLYDDTTYASQAALVSSTSTG